MTQEAHSYAIWRPEYDGHAPPNWRDGTEILEFRPIGTTEWRELAILPSWGKNFEYKVPPEALTAPNEDAKLDGWAIGGALSIIRAMSPDELAKHGITLAPERDWATELWDVLITTWQNAGNEWEGDQAAIALIRERVQLKEGV